HAIIPVIIAIFIEHFSNVKKNFLKPNLESLFTYDKRKINRVATLPAIKGVNLNISIAIKIIRGKNKCQLLFNVPKKLGNSFFSKPRIPFLLALKSTKNHIDATKIIAGTTDTLTISKYSTPIIAAIKKAPVPITGGIICPAAEETVSIAPASWGLYPVFFIKGIVKFPVVTT